MRREGPLKSRDAMFRMYYTAKKIKGVENIHQVLLHDQLFILIIHLRCKGPLCALLSYLNA
ncbi:hypothetical protein WG66_002931 [Moniliophthora roreri]|nr:hypothetical protein WG66_002931 [Moniliophthora roreri]